MVLKCSNSHTKKLEQQILNSSLSIRPLVWFCFIDNIDMKLDNTEQEFNVLIQHANDDHPSIKFTYEISDSLGTSTQAQRQTSISFSFWLSPETLPHEQIPADMTYE